MSRGTDIAQLTPLILPCPHSIVVVHVLLETILLFVGSWEGSTFQDQQSLVILLFGTFKLC